MRKLVVIMVLFSILVGCTKYTSDVDFVDKNINIISAGTNISRDYLIKSGWELCSYELYRHEGYKIERSIYDKSNSFSMITVWKKHFDCNTIQDTTRVMLDVNFSDTIYYYLNGAIDTTETYRIR